MTDNNLQQAGLKSTSSRRCILAVFEQHQQHHLSADDIHQILRNNNTPVSLATIYRVLAQFEAADLILRHSFEGDAAVYELADSEHHDHLVCVKCNCVEEFVDETIEQHQQLVAEKAGFSICDHNLTIYGICPSCQQNS